jgi:hypothetical protein
MAWERIFSFGKSVWQEFEPRVQSTNSKAVFIPMQFRGQLSSWYLDREKKIAKLKIEKEGLKKLHKTITIPKEILKAIGEDQFIKIYNKNGLYIGGYKAGSERIVKLMKVE